MSVSPRSETTPKLYIFDCPVHGLEIGVHCHRAHDEKNLDRWFVCPLKLIEPTEEELEEIKLQMGMQEA